MKPTAEALRTQRSKEPCSKLRGLEDSVAHKVRGYESRDSSWSRGLSPTSSVTEFM